MFEKYGHPDIKVFHLKSAPMAIETIKILGAVLKLPAEQHCQFSIFLGKWAGLAVEHYREI